MDIRELELFLRGRKGIGKWTAENIKLTLQEERILKTLQARQSYLSTFIPDWVTLDQNYREYLTEVNALRTTATLLGIVFSIFDTSRKAYFVGSRREGTFSSNPDQDQMAVYYILHEREAKDILFPINGFPGFVVVNLSNASNDELLRMRTKEAIIQVNDEVYLSGKVLKEKEKQLYQEKLSAVRSQRKYKPTGQDRVTFKYEDGGRKEATEFDMAVAVGCGGWPSVAQGWESRDRKWPGKELIQEILQTGYHLVPKADPDCPIDPEIQWRISFSFAEVNLMDSVNGVCLLAYRIVKNILKRVSVLDADTCTSYHLKTAFFWECEQHTQDWWEPRSLQTCIRALMRRLMDACSNKQLPHYFIQNLNLFEKVQGSKLDGIAEKLQTIVERVEVQTEDVPSLPVSVEPQVGCTTIMMAMKECLLPQAYKALRNEEHLVLKVFPEYLKYTQKDLRQTLSFYSMMTCLYEQYLPEAGVSISAIEYLINCAFMALSFAENYFVSQLDLVLEKWRQMFPENDILYFLFTGYLHVHVSGIPKFHSEPIALFHRYKQLCSQYEVVSFRLLDKFRWILDNHSYEDLKGNHEDVLQRLALKPEDFIHEGIHNQLETRFELPEASYLTLHDMADPDVWVRGLTYDQMKEKVQNEGHKTCHGNCFQRCLEESSHILEESGLERDLHLHTIMYGDRGVLYLEGDEVKNYSMLKQITQTKMMKTKSCI